jgi:NAD-dependent dihydropyrimidine dehydrogenase PreA subunit
VQEAKDYSPEIVEGYNNIGVRAVAAHELAHLAGAQDKVFFVIDEMNCTGLSACMSRGLNLKNGPI